jgi:tRNA(fMet)-specific endonuclease VapC
VRRRFLLDTNVLSEPLKPRPDEKIIAAIEERFDAIATAAPVWHELLFGVRALRGKRLAMAERFVETVLAPNLPILPYDASAAAWHASERVRLASVGRTPEFVDGQIASIAAANGLVLVTRNLRDYRSFVGLELQDWHGA